MIVIVTDNKGSYGADVADLVANHGATMHEMHPVLGKSQMRSKLSLLPPLLFPNVKRYRQLWKPEDDVVCVTWYLIPVLLLTKLRLVHKPRTIVSWGLFVQNKWFRALTFNLVRVLKNDRLFYIADSSVEEVALHRFAKLNADRMVMLPFRYHEGLGEKEPTGESYVFSGGYTNRDYHGLIEAVRNIDEKVEIAATPANEMPADVPGHITISTEFNPPKFLAKVAESRLVVIPLKQSGGGSGHSVLLQALQYHKPVIVTRHPAIIDTLGDDYAGYVNAGDVAELRSAIHRALTDESFNALLRAESVRCRAEVDAWPKMSDEILGILRRLHPARAGV